MKRAAKVIKHFNLLEHVHLCIIFRGAFENIHVLFVQTENSYFGEAISETNPTMHSEMVNKHVKVYIVQMFRDFFERKKLLLLFSKDTLKWSKVTQ